MRVADRDPNHYTYQVSCTFTFQRTFTDSEVEVASGDLATSRPRRSALAALEQELATVLGEHFVVSSLECRPEHLVGYAAGVFGLVGGVDLRTRTAVEAAGFRGFVPIRELRVQSCRQIPREPGVYLVFRPSTDTPGFLEKGTGATFKERNPNVSLEALHRAWVPAATVLYIGKAGTDQGSANLRTRISQYVRFGTGEAAPHWGGRYIWQLADADDLLFAWKEVAASRLPRDEERELLAAFQQTFLKLPFANRAE